METSVGIRFNDHVIVACSGAAAFYYFLLSEKEDKLMEIDSHKVAAAVGDQSDRVRLLQYVKCSLKPQQIQSGKAQSTSACANFLRKHMAESLRSRRGMYQTNLMFAGYDLPQSETGDESVAGPSLYWIDYLCAMQKVNYGAHGYGGSFITALLDQKYDPNMSEAEGIALIKDCIACVNKRLIVTQGEFVVKVIDKNGTHIVEV